MTPEQLYEVLRRAESPDELMKLRSWDKQAACLDADPELFYPDKGESVEPAKEICADCPVRDECLVWACARRELFGIWGGVSPLGRKPIRRALAQGATLTQARAERAGEAA